MPPAALMSPQAQNGDIQPLAFAMAARAAATGEGFGKGSLRMAGKNTDRNIAILCFQDSQDISIGLLFSGDENRRFPIVDLIGYFTHGGKWFRE